jgi:hypothetical protein
MRLLICYRLLGQVGIQKSIHVVDVTSAAMGKSKATGKSTDASVTAAGGANQAVAGKAGEGGAVEGAHAMPAGLKQEELHVPSDEKDVYAYCYINKVSVGGLCAGIVQCSPNLC